jgi:hypothetical protein
MRTQMLPSLSFVHEQVFTDLARAESSLLQGAVTGISLSGAGMARAPCLGSVAQPRANRHRLGIGTMRDDAACSTLTGRVRERIELARGARGAGVRP